MTHEFKNYIDLKQFEGLSPVHFVEREDIQNTEMLIHYRAPQILAYARELEERIVRLQYAGDVLAELVDHYVPKKEDVLKMWRNA